MIFTMKPSELIKIKISIPNGTKTALQVHQQEACHLAVNGTLYNMSNYKPCMDMRADGRTLAMETGNGPHYPGFGWNNTDTKLTYSDNPYAWNNYITGSWLCRNGRAESTYVWNGVGGARPRTGIGTKPDGTIVVYCDSKNYTPDLLRTIMMDQGCNFVLMLDSGGSTQYSSNEGNLLVARKVANFLCFTKQGNPYQIPTVTVKNGSKGESSYWVQWNLHNLGYTDAKNRPITVDGIFGANSVAALKKYQKDNGLIADGICGAKTIKTMNK